MRKAEADIEVRDCATDSNEGTSEGGSSELRAKDARNNSERINIQAFSSQLVRGKPENR